MRSVEFFPGSVCGWHFSYLGFTVNIPHCRIITSVGNAYLYRSLAHRHMKQAEGRIWPVNQGGPRGQLQAYLRLWIWPPEQPSDIAASVPG